MRDATRTLPACAEWIVPVSPVEDIWDWQEGRCAFCGWDGDRLVRDHDHDTDLIRGLLCGPCNTYEPYGLGNAWKLYRQGVNPANILAIHELYEPMNLTIMDRAYIRHRDSDPEWQRLIAWNTL